MTVETAAIAVSAGIHMLCCEIFGVIFWELSAAHAFSCIVGKTAQHSTAASH
jgi:hypothetical protein